MQKGIIKNVNKLTGEPIDAKDLASLFSGIIGDESGVLTVFDELRLEKISDNKVRLHSGVYSLKGHILYIPKGSYEDFEIDSGTLGANRIDLLVAEYVKNGKGDGEDLLHFKVVKGEVSSGQPQTPDLIQQDINQNGITRQEVLYEIRVSGTDIKTISKANKIYTLQKSYQETQDDLKEINRKIQDTRDTRLYTHLSNHIIEWGEVSGTPSSSGYLAGRSHFYMKEPENAVLISSTKGFGSRNLIVNGRTVRDKNKLLEFWVHDTNGNPVTTKVTLQYILISSY